MAAEVRHFSYESCPLNKTFSSALHSSSMLFWQLIAFFLSVLESLTSKNFQSLCLQVEYQAKKTNFTDKKREENKGGAGFFGTD